MCAPEIDVGERLADVRPETGEGGLARDNGYGEDALAGGQYRHLRNAGASATSLEGVSRVLVVPEDDCHKRRKEM